MRNLVMSLLLCATAFNTALGIEIKYGPYLQRVENDRATIVWVTDSPALSWVEIAPDDSLNFYAEERPQYYDTWMGRKKIGTVHKVTIDKLEPGTKYRYRIFSQEVTERNGEKVHYGDVASTDVYTKAPLTFTTGDDRKLSNNFVVINDMHANNDRIHHLLDGVNWTETEFAIFNGDMVSWMDSEQQVFEGFVNTACDIFAKEIPFYMSRGNHESRGKFASEFLNYFPTPTGLPYYTIKRGPMFFIILDGGEDKPDNDIEYYGTAAFDDYREREAEWLSEVLKSQDFKSSPFKVVVTHVPPVNDTWHGPLHANRLFLPLLNKAGIDLMLCAHLHEYVYSPAGTVGANFPILINSNREILNIDASDKQMNVTVKDESGRTTHHYTYDANV